METVILGWYVMVQTGSVLLLTAFGSLLLLGTLVSPMFGVLGDRLGGRVMLCVMRAIYTVLAALVLLLTLTGSLAPVWVFVVASLAGIVRPNDQVMRNALIGETIPPPHLMGAVGLSRATMDSARVFGALAGAALSTILGIAFNALFAARRLGTVAYDPRFTNDKFGVFVPAGPGAAAAAEALLKGAGAEEVRRG